MAQTKRFSSDAEARVLEGVRVLADGNPFLPERVEGERAVLGKAFVETSAVWHVDTELEGLNPNLQELGSVAERLSG